MKKILAILFLCYSGHLFAIKGMYVDGFASILGNTNKEDSLLNYAQQNGFTYLALYELHLVHAAHNLTTVPTSAPLATFILKAKTMYGITEIGACSENFWWFNNIASVYNSIHSDPNEQFDVYNLEFEFWNPGSVGPGQYYCTTYLSPGGYSCDTSGAFAFYMKELTSIDSLATVDGVKSEIYVGWFNQYQATQMKSKADRILLHSYVNTVNNVYSYAQTRLAYLGNTSGIVDVMPIYSAEPSFLGPWLNSNPEIDANPIYLNGFTSDVGSWKANINLIGYQWFAYSFMPYGLPLGIEKEKDIQIYPNPVINMVQISNDNGEELHLQLMDYNGILIKELKSNAHSVCLHVTDIPAGVYYLTIAGKEGFIVRKVIKTPIN